jgi:hypothetical protein
LLHSLFVLCKLNFQKENFSAKDRAIPTVKAG